MTTKNKLHYFGLLALIIVMVTIVMVLAACPDDTDSEKGTETLTISGQVNERKIHEALKGVMDSLDLEDPEALDNLDMTAIANSLGSVLISGGQLISYNGINGDMVISDGGMGGAGEIKNGKLSYSIKRPAEEKLVSATDQIGALTQRLGLLSAAGLPNISGIYSDVKVSPANTRAALLNLEIKNSDVYSLIDREFIQNTLSSFMPPVLTITVEGVSYVYVDRKATITATGTPLTVPINLTLPNIKLNLKKGWNALGVKVTITAEMSPSLNISGKVDYSCRQPSKVPASLKWVANPPTPHQ